ncbi:MAG: hypothetical protein CO031_00205 [Candidatus Nealsonbacteria bacterium CG_4_9_14_0_2_um_filter_37_38]|uniref:Uncharacterized protein n=1 Tax=Candidatus Nealsonbacteria bacterium CG_4_10_14_0_8_um_filter_37_14 TaxID=1974684 RepID=A0A2M7R697_9BACT|nr:MAG: hypothetical protein COV63_00450 [Candidatus Nealsonbacteria bacterium CG11_big_fil_rev_8_21_14_0_20_37_68]PIW91796.1 MAG: hypothetical protein COZ89_03310 [Candidatus Nealsonbacteria bacterium CG_4_8_14_3_um_filter_37_23]PIY89102.1 MAG: hypothetical protein COY73_01940 [Candidatus Nealsonbacteria bacterium CG_4_10_14_0_8_um_filter_37_14]PJC51909.1 MAG: hypothetical protein CO031_00205 [Candidatus Nealsonbacteria bacterium CG_4_9_14_0_2_um_filter_37_38]
MEIMKDLPEKMEWKPVELNEEQKERLKKGMEMFQQALAEDAKKEKGFILPKDLIFFRDMTIEVTDPKTGKFIPVKHYGLPRGAENWLMGV